MRRPAILFSIASVLLVPLIVTEVVAEPSPVRRAEVRWLEVGDGRLVPSVFRSGAPGSTHGRGAGVAAAVVNGDFEDDLAGWSASESGGTAAPGGVEVIDGEAVLAEGDSFLVTLEQTFVVPEGADRLRFELRLEPGFDTSAEFIPDAVEATLVDDAGIPVLAPWSDEATSFFNLAEDETASVGDGVEWADSTVTVDLGAVEPGTMVTLYFDLIGADEDTAGGVRVDGVALEEATTSPEGFVRGNANADASLDISDPIVVLTYLFVGGREPQCLLAADANDDDSLDISDPIYTLAYLFLGGPPPPVPFPDCGFEEDDLSGLECSPCACPPYPLGHPCAE